MPDLPTVALSHSGVCTSDLDRAVRFYCDGLGFAFRNRIEIAEPYDRLAELPGLRVRIAFVLLGDRVLELMDYDRPHAVGSAERRPMNQLGLTHLAFMVSDIDAVTTRIAAAGGHVLDETRVEAPGSIAMYCTDPDGTRIELTQIVG